MQVAVCALTPPARDFFGVVPEEVTWRRDILIALSFCPTASCYVSAVAFSAAAIERLRRLYLCKSFRAYW